MAEAIRLIWKVVKDVHACLARLEGLRDQVRDPLRRARQLGDAAPVRRARGLTAATALRSSQPMGTYVTYVTDWTTPCLSCALTPGSSRPILWA